MTERDPEPAGREPAAVAARERSLRFDRQEWAGAFGDLGTLIPFLIGYVGLGGIAPASLLASIGVALVAAGLVYRTPFPVQPMKAAGAIAITQAAGGVAITAGAIHAAALATGAFWLLLGLTGAARRIARCMGAPVAQGLVLGLGVAFMIEGARAMGEGLLVAVPALAGTLLLLRSRAVPAMFLLLALGPLVALAQDPALLARLAVLRPGFAWPSLAWPSLDRDAWTVGVLFIAIPQLPLTLGNAVIAVTEANNRLFPDRPASETRVVVTTGAMNLAAGTLGGIPLCHGAGGLAAQVRFGARTGGAPVILGTLLLALGLFGSASVATLLELFPHPLLGVALFLAGLQLAAGFGTLARSAGERAVLLGTAGLAVWNVGIAFVFGVAALALVRRGILRL
ncbi:MAG: hypothetical protein BroJett026_14050 [Betaproteobacteria bacterium]|nr:MAG: hypothetical protein BroJett026_14050 [Betaproteobacteria bacterium]